MTRLFISKLAAASLLVCATALAAESSLRLAGIIAPENGRALALIELPNGEQELFRVGDSIEDGLVVEVSASLVRLDLPQGELVLRLEGTGDPAVNLPTEYWREDYQGGAPARVDSQDLQAISRLAESADDIEPEELAEKVLKHLDLSPEARIMAIDDQPVESTSDAVRKMAGTIDAKSEDDSPFHFRLSVAEVRGNQRIYIFVDGEGQVTKRTIPAN